MSTQISGGGTGKKKAGVQSSPITKSQIASDLNSGLNPFARVGSNIKSFSPTITKAKTTMAAAKPAPAPVVKAPAKAAPVQTKAAPKTATKTAAKTAPTKSTPASSSVGGGTNTLAMQAAMQNGLTPNSTYQPVDISGLLSGLNTPFDPSSTSALFDPQYQSLQDMRNNEQQQYNSGDSRLASLYSGLQQSIKNSASPVLAAYNSAASNDATNGNTASQAIADAGTALANQRQAMLQNLGIQAAAPGLNAADTATLQGQTKVQQAAGLSSNLASLLGANANAYIQNTANNALQAGNEQRSNLLQEYNNDSSTLDQKQADLDSAKAQAIASAASAYSTAQSNSYDEYVKAAMQNALNASNAQTAANAQGITSTQNMINNGLSQAKLDLAQQSEAAKEAQNNVTNSLAQQKLNSAAVNSNQGTMAQVSNIGINDLKGGDTRANRQSVSNALAFMQSLAGKNTYSNAAALAAAVQKQTNNAKLNAAISDMAIKYWSALYSKGSPSTTYQ